MAVPPATNATSGKSAAGTRFRQRKISVKVALPIYNQCELSGPDLELEPSQLHHLNAVNQAQRDPHTVETGVDKNEEDEVHLQQVINAAQQALLGAGPKISANTGSVYIPTPDASCLWPEAYKYYNDKSFVEPESHIKFSATVEDTLGIEYNMDEVDEEFFNETLNSYPKLKNSNGSHSAGSGASGSDGFSAGSSAVNGNVEHTDDTRRCSELEFEAVCDKFEKTIELKQPFLSVDPSTILSYKELCAVIMQELTSTALNDPYFNASVEPKYMSTSSIKEKLSKELNFKPFVTTFDKTPGATQNIRSIPKLLELFGEPIYNHFRARKIERKGKPITPVLKFEDPSATEKDNDSDPYICFRRREFRQARKTRRADNFGAERIRLLQRSLEKAHELLFNVCQREILKLQSLESEFKIFRLRCEAKAVKRAVGIKGDNHLFYPHKRKKIVLPDPVEDDEQALRIKRQKRKTQEIPVYTPAQSRETSYVSSQQPEVSTTQPYVKLPPSKIPDLEVLTVASVLQEKNETIKRAVAEKLRKRKELDRGWVNITYDPYQPFFTFSTNKLNEDIEMSHIPYSSIAANYLHQFNTSSVISDHLKRAIENPSRPLPGTKTFSGANGEMIASRPFPHLQTLLSNHLNNPENGNPGYIAQFLANIKSHDFSAYSSGFGGAQDKNENSEASGPVFRLRKRAGRAGQVYVDRRGLFRRPTDEIDEWLNLADSDEEIAQEVRKGEDRARTSKPAIVKDAYHNKRDSVARLDSQWRFSDDITKSEMGMTQPFSFEPSRLNDISDDTQSIRFGSMLLSKSYDLLRESAQNRLKAIQARMHTLQSSRQPQQDQVLARDALGGASVARNSGPQSSVASSSAGSCVSGDNADMSREPVGYTLQQAQLQRQQIQQGGGVNARAQAQARGFAAPRRSGALNS